jgi:hypothetical protein
MEQPCNQAEGPFPELLPKIYTMLDKINAVCFSIFFLNTQSQKRTMARKVQLFKNKDLFFEFQE